MQLAMRLTMPVPMQTSVRSSSWLSVQFVGLMILCCGVACVAPASADESLPVTGQTLGAASGLVHETEETLELRSGDRVVLAYRKTAPPLPEGIDPVYQNSGFLHPVQTPAGHVVTAAYPRDHAHQHGVFCAWVDTTYADTKIDFWNLSGRTGRVEHERVVAITNDELPGFEVTQIHRALVPSPVDVLRETWKVRLVAASDQYHCFDLDLQQQALTDEPLLIHEYHYGGMAVRGPTAWLLPEGRRADDTAADASSQDAISKGAISLSNELQSDRLSGNHQPTRWVSMAGPFDTDVACIVVMSHESNFRAPQVARLHPTKPYCCFAPCVTGQFVIDREHEYHGKYRFLVLDEVPTQEWLEAQWQAWHKQ